MPARDLIGCAQSGQVDVLIPGDQQLSVSSKRSMGARREVDAYGQQSGIDDGPEVGAQLGQAVDGARKSRSRSR
jgi:hypothetical protein